MRWDKVITVVHAHAEGEVGRVITGGVLDVPGATMFDKKRHLETENDDLRRFVLFEPRGGAAMSANLLLPPCDARADLGMIVMESTDYPPMSGSNAMCVVTVALETGVVPMSEPETRLVLDTPAGLVHASAACRDGKCESVTLESVPCFVDRLDATIEVEGVGTVAADIAYGGAFFAIVDSQAFGLELVPGEARHIVELGQRITAAAAEQAPVAHPENAGINTVSFTLFGGPPRGPEKMRRSAVVVAPGRLDRSPCGTGTIARLAVLHARGEIAPDDALIHESIIGTHFTASIAGATTVGGKAALVPRLSGRAWITGIGHYGHDPSDPFARGFVLADTWGIGADDLG
ncbi:MAG: proline racemase family protein [Alphaproteobacteria bacterium]